MARADDDAHVRSLPVPALKVRARDSIHSVMTAVSAHVEALELSSSLLRSLQDGGVRPLFLGHFLKTHSAKPLSRRHIRLAQQVYNAARKLVTSDLYSRRLVQAVDRVMHKMFITCSTVDIEVEHMGSLFNLVAMRSHMQGEEDVAFWGWVATVHGCNRPDCDEWSRRRNYMLGQWFVHGLRWQLHTAPAMARVLAHCLSLARRVFPVEAECFHDTACISLAAFPHCAVWDDVLQSVFRDEYMMRTLLNHVAHARCWERGFPGGQSLRALATRVTDPHPSKS